MPEVSVIMGVNNGGRFVAESLSSLKRQTYPDWELVLVDNGSVDGAVEAELRQRPDSRIRVFKYPQPLTPGGAMAVACQEARGRFLAVLDHDDLATATRLALQVSYLSAQPEVMLLGGASELIDGDGRVLGREPFVGLHEDIFALTAYVHVLRHSGIMFRRELIARVPYRPVLGIAADFDFIARAAEVGRVAAVPAITCQYRLHAHNRSSLAVGSAVKGGLTRMLTRRRRQGRSEDLEHWNERFAAGAATDDPVSAHLHCARIFANEGLDDLAAFHAWLAWRAGGGLGAALRYAGAVGRGLGRRPVAMATLAKAWLKEPVHQLLRAEGVPDRPQF